MRNSSSDTRGRNLKTRFRSEALEGLKKLEVPEILRYSDADHLPAIVRKYLQYTGAFGKPRVHNLHAVFSGHMRQKQGGNWIDIKASQYSFFDDPRRVFNIGSKMFGVRFDGLHLYKDAHATMEVKLASTLKVASGKGPVMDKSETVTYFNDLCLLAPGALVDNNIKWETVEHQTVRGTFTNQGCTISALLYFNDDDELVNFVSEDRSMAIGKDGYVNYRWSTPVKGYQECDGRRVFSAADAVWSKPDGEFVYAQFDLKEIQYNVNNFEG